MAVTQLSDLTTALNTPFAVSRLQKYVTDLSAFVRSGICLPSPDIAALVRATGAMGKIGSLPFLNDLNGDDEALAEGTELTENKLTGGNDTYVIHRRGKAFAAYDLASVISGGGDVIGAAIKLVGDYQVRQRQTMLFRTLKGVFADNLAHDNGDLILDITDRTGDDAYLSKYTLMEAAQLLGDHKYKLTAVAMHSFVEDALTRLSGDSQTYKAAADQTGLATYNGKKIVMDDACGYDADTGIAELYLFAEGAIAMESAVPGPEMPLFENYRDAKSGKSGLIERDCYIMHPRGFAWVGGTTADTPSNETVESGNSWDRVWNKKDARIVKLVCKVR